MIRVIEKNKKVVAEAPFRLDLGMGGVSDLEWWNKRDGDCLSICCEFEELAIEVFAETIDCPKIVIVGFDNTTKEKKYIYNDINTYVGNKFLSLPLASIKSAFELLEAKKINCTNIGLKLSHTPSKAKGMGGSSAVAACVINLITTLYGLKKVTFNELVNSVIKAEKYAGIGGGWEDVAGIYKPKVNWVKYRATLEPNMRLCEVKENEEAYQFLNDNLIIFDSGIPASTSKILDNAKQMYENNERIVIENTKKLQKECSIIAESIENANVNEFGKSLSRQRNYWNLITNGISASKQVDKIIEGMIENINGYREAGAGAGGMVLVVCKKNKSNIVKAKLKKQGYKVYNWKISEFGLEN